MVVATGFFDGVHLGHRLVIDKLVSSARERGEESLVVTFWPHPRTVLQQGAREFRLLSSLDEKRGLLLACGVDRVEVLPFTKAFSHLTTEQYLRETVQGRFGATAIVLGYDNRMGAASGDPDEIERIARRLGLDVIRTGSVGGDRPISSTLVRTAVAEGRVEDAAAMLGRCYQLTGVVVGGKQLGRTIGFPTANTKLYEPLKLVPAVGVYLVQVFLGERSFYGMCNIADRIETHIFNFDEQIYGLDLRIAFICRIRDEIRFNSLDALKARLTLDRETCLDELASRGLSPREICG